ncbi:TetR/AcrR family transcriptional regulator, partial [Pseudonocardia sp. KRD-169]|nr:TetR/AcrR family transcriptional regulator [Pseudonocardia abyssalis]
MRARHRPRAVSDWPRESSTCFLQVERPFFLVVGTLPPGRCPCKTDRSFCYRHVVSPAPRTTSDIPAASPDGGSTAGPGRSEARERLLSTASGLFYREGIRAVGVERIVAETPTTRATFYRHFPSKEALVVAYLHGVDVHTRGVVHEAIRSAASPGDAVRAIGTSLVGDLSRPEFRGCAFLKAAAEFPDSENAVHRVVVDHRTWYVATLTDLFTQVFGSSPRRGRPEHAAQHFLMMRDGAMAGAHLDGATHVGAAFTRGLEGLLTL